MRGNNEENTAWKKDAGRTSRALTVATAVMAVIGFSLVGVVAFGAAAGSAVSSHGAIDKVGAQMSAQLHPSGTKKFNSDNWGGYAVAGANGSVKEVFAEWFVPTISCASHTPSVATQWVGIDGFNNGNVEQAGSYEYCNGVSSTPYYWVWFEFYPYEDIQSVAQVSAGDLINAYVLYSPACYIVSGVDYCGVYTLVVNDLDNSSANFAIQGNPSTCTGTDSCEGGPGADAECISESLTNQGYYLPDYGTEWFYSCDVTANGYEAGIGHLPSGAHMTLWEINTYGYDSGKLQQKVSKFSSLVSKDDSFSLTWKKYD
jgi:hypothetical protein